MGAGASSSVATTKEVPAVLDSNGYARWEQGNGRAEISSSSAAQLVEPQSVPKDFKPISRGGNPAKTLAPPRERRRRRMTEMNQKKSVFNDDLSEFIRRYMRGEENLNLETGSDEPSDDDLSRSLMRKRAAAQTAIQVALDYFCFASCSEEVKMQFVAALKEETFVEGEYVYREDDPGDKLYVVESGTVDMVVGGRSVGTAQVGAVFGELSLIYGTTRPASALVATERVVLWSLGQANFRRLQATVSMESLGLSFRSAQRGRTKSQLSDWVPLDVRLEDLTPIATIGVGSFGYVDMVRHRSDADHVYALKRVSKQFVHDRGFERKILQEKETLARLDSPFVMKLLATFQDERWLCFLTELAPGGDLMELICEAEKLDDATTRFLGICLAEALNVVHEAGYVHRDVKPENCLIGADGYLKLADFGLAKPLPCVLDIGNGRVEAVGVSYTMCGSPEFMAPESVLSLGYDRTADYWAFGCVLFELFFGHNPFDNGGDLKATFVAVASIGLGKSEITFPPEANGSDEWAEDLLRRLLVSKSRRIASPHLFRHPFFEGISVEQLRRKELVAPFRPVLQSAIDTSYLAMPAPESIVEAPVFIRPPTDEPDPFEAW